MPGGGAVTVRGFFLASGAGIDRIVFDHAPPWTRDELAGRALVLPDEAHPGNFDTASWPSAMLGAPTAAGLEPHHGGAFGDVRRRPVLRSFRVRDYPYARVGMGMMGICVLRLAPAAAVALAATMAVAAAGTPQHSGTDGQCTLQGGPTRAVMRVLDAETVLLDDNQEVRLIGALAPRSPDLNPGAQPWKAEEDATAALRALVLGRSVSLATSGRTRDRYGRTLAHLFVERGRRARVGAGRAAERRATRASMACPAATPACASCWRTSASRGRPRAGCGRTPPTRCARRDARASSCAGAIPIEIVAGTAVKVAVTKARTYINFGADWRSDFTAGIEARVLRANPEWAQDAGRARRQAHRGARLDPVPQRALHRHRGSEPDRAGRRDAARIARRRRPVPMTSSDRDEMPTRPPPENEKRPAPKVPGALDL